MDKTKDIIGYSVTHHIIMDFMFTEFYVLLVKFNINSRRAFVFISSI